MSFRCTTTTRNMSRAHGIVTATSSILGFHATEALAGKKLEHRNHKPKMKAATEHLHWSERLRGLIQNIEPLGSFVHTQVLTTAPLLPHVTVKGVGRLGFPMLDVVVNTLIAASVTTKAPYGKRDRTLMNTKVRDTWQIDATNITIGGGDLWTQDFSCIVRAHCFNLGISDERFGTLDIEANLYKMLIYEEGGHFLTHRDTEKEPHMFGTLILQLPTSDGFDGGALTVSHRGTTKRIELSTNSDNEFQTVSFYADCEHELLPITRGQRVCLVYNLVATSPEKIPTTIPVLPSHDVNIETEVHLRSICNDWKTSGDVQKITKIGYQLEHEYTRQSISLSTLKGRDEIVFATLRNARNSNGKRLFCVSILLMEFFDNEDDCHARPYMVIEETADNTLERKSVQQYCIGDFSEEAWKCGFESLCNDSDWDMVCHSKNGWWVMPKVDLQNVVEEYKQAAKVKNELEGKSKVTSDGLSANTEKSPNDKNMDDDTDYQAFEFMADRQMFLSRCEEIKKEAAYHGNAGGTHQTFYYSAAVIISPMEDDSVVLESSTLSSTSNDQK